jgi:oxepin-CoA hydrolase/3-oxo-5,6-dehydrosuberyl-CoA semialdehyde dehydrogenase
LDIARQFIAGAARAHGRIQILNEEASKESTGHGSPLPQLVHGGPDARAAAKSWAACAR